MKREPRLTFSDPRSQEKLPHEPYDRWITPDGDIVAEFHRAAEGICIRFPEQADFHLDRDLTTVHCLPAEGIAHDALETLYANSIRPMIGNHLGELNLHGSAAVIDGKALAIVGTSRRGKTTLAGALAKEGHPFLTEDVLALAKTGGGYMVQPQPPVLRVMPDSRAFLTGRDARPADQEGKQAITAGPQLPAAASPAPLAAIAVLGDGSASSLDIAPMSPAAALAEIMQHGFVLDVEDKPRLRAHFDRMAELVAAVPCHVLDYPRDFTQLEAVCKGISQHFSGAEHGHVAD